MSRLIIVIVLYKTKIEDSLAYNTLMSNALGLDFNYTLLVYNNSAFDIEVPVSNSYISYNSDNNSLLNTAYNYAYNFAKKEGIEWILLLDQDTEITIEYLQKLASFILGNQDAEIVATVPILKSGNKILSPKLISNIGWWQNDITTIGCQNVGRVTAFNSLCMLKVSFVESIGGFSDKYPLDMLDHWYFNQIRINRKKVYVFDSIIEHSLSLLTYEDSISLQRHATFLNSERLFVRNELTLSHYFFYKFRLFLRLIRQTLVFKNKDYPRITLKILLK